MTAPGAVATNVTGFNLSTRNRRYDLPSQTSTTANGDILTFPIPPVGLIARIYLSVIGTINAVTSGPNKYGLSSIIKNIRLQSNAGYDLFNMSGPGYFHLFAPNMDFPGNAFPQSTAKNAVAASAPVNLPVCIPMAVNLRDVTGLIAAANRQTVLTLYVQFETDTNIASGGMTWTARPTVLVTIEYFQIPVSQAAQPPLMMLHQIIEQQEAVSAAGTYDHVWQRGNIYLQKIHGLGFQVTTPTDNWTTCDLKINQNDTLYHLTPAGLDVIYPILRYQQRAKGVIPFDFVGQSGLGLYDPPRDALNSQLYTDIHSVFNASGADTLYTVSRQLIPLT